jgi:hypothetical protein
MSYEIQFLIAAFAVMAASAVVLRKQIKQARVSRAEGLQYFRKLHKCNLL